MAVLNPNMFDLFKIRFHAYLLINLSLEVTNNYFQIKEYDLYMNCTIFVIASKPVKDFKIVLLLR